MFHPEAVYFKPLRPSAFLVMVAKTLRKRSRRLANHIMRTNALLRSLS